MAEVGEPQSLVLEPEALKTIIGVSGTPPGPEDVDVLDKIIPPGLPTVVTQGVVNQVYNATARKNGDGDLVYEQGKRRHIETNFLRGLVLLGDKREDVKGTTSALQCMRNSRNELAREKVPALVHRVQGLRKLMGNTRIA